MNNKVNSYLTIIFIFCSHLFYTPSQNQL